MKKLLILMACLGFLMVIDRNALPDQITDMTPLSQGDIDSADWFTVVDVDDTTMAGTGTNKKYAWSSVLTDVSGSFAPLNSATPTGTWDFTGADVVFPQTIDFSTATDFSIMTSTSDLTLDSAGDIGIQQTDDGLGIHFGSAGEISGEAHISGLYPVSVVVDPGTWYDNDQEIFLFTVGDECPEGAKIVEWKSSCNVAPDVEVNADLRYADAWIGLANPNDIDEIDTSSGVSSEDTNANINSNTAVANGKVVYIGFDADPEGTCVQWIFEMWYYCEED